MKRFLTTLLMLLCMTACEKYDWAPQLESGEINITRSNLEGYWKHTGCTIENYDANGAFINTEYIVGGNAGRQVIYDYFRFTGDEMWSAYYSIFRDYIKDDVTNLDTVIVDEIRYFKKYPLKIMSNGELISPDFDCLGGWHPRDNCFTNARITKMDDQQIIIYAKFKNNENAPARTAASYNKFVFTRAYPSKDFYEFFAEELK